MAQHFIHIPSLLKPDELKEIDEILARAKFVDGKTSATLGAQIVKNNLQLDDESDELAAIRSILARALKTSPLFGIAALPKTIHPFLILSLIHISEPTRLLSISYAVFCLKK